MSKNLKYFLISFVFTAFFAIGINLSQQNLESFFYAQITKPFGNIVFVQAPKKPKKPDLLLNTEAAISLKTSKSGREKTIYEKDKDRGLPIASLTKLMTALVALQNHYDLSETIIVTKEAASQRDIPNYGNLKEGEVFTVEQLLILMMLYSSNDAAFALADSIGADMFVLQMNEMADLLGMEKTNFINPTGLDATNTEIIPNYSTLDDLIKLTKHLLEKYPIVFQFSIRQGPYPNENGISQVVMPEGQVLIGGKTGYTEKAGGCMVVITEDERQSKYIYAVLGSKSPEERVQSIQKLINWSNL